LIAKGLANQAIGAPQPNPHTADGWKGIVDLIASRLEMEDTMRERRKQFFA
jgi:hypothetical protein